MYERCRFPGMFITFGLSALLLLHKVTRCITMLQGTIWCCWHTNIREWKHLAYSYLYLDTSILVLGSVLSYCCSIKLEILYQPSWITACTWEDCILFLLSRNKVGPESLVPGLCQSRFTMITLLVAYQTQHLIHFTYWGLEWLPVSYTLQRLWFFLSHKICDNWAVA